jgi:hypothetical protein
MNLKKDALDSVRSINDILKCLSRHIPEEKSTKVTSQYENRKAQREIRGGFEWKRAIYYAEKQRGVREQVAAVTLNGKDWGSEGPVPPNSLITFVPRLGTHVPP